MSTKAESANAEATAADPVVGAANFAEFEKLRANGKAETAPAEAVVEPVAEPKAPSKEANPPSKEAEPTAAAPVSAEDDGDAGPGEPPATETKSGDLPRGVKRRLEREKRRTELARQESEALRARVAELEATPASGKPAPATAEPAPEATPAVVSDEPLPESEYTFDYPDEKEYVADDKDADGLASFLEDVERWEKNIPLKGGKSAKAPASQPAETRTEPAPETPAQQPRTAIQLLFQDIQEALEEDDAPSETLAGDFMDQVKANRFHLSEPMVRWMADSEDAAIVADAFVKSPRRANRIFRSPANQQASLLASLATDIKGDGEAAPEGARGTNGSGKATTVVKPLSNRKPANPAKKLAQATDFKEFEALRRNV